MILGEPKLDSIKTLRPLGPRVAATALARVSTPARRDFRAWAPKRRSCDEGKKESQQELRATRDCLKGEGFLPCGQIEAAVTEAQEPGERSSSMRAAFCVYVKGERKGDDDVGRISLDETGTRAKLRGRKNCRAPGQLRH